MTLKWTPDYESYVAPDRLVRAEGFTLFMQAPKAFTCADDEEPLHGVRGDLIGRVGSTGIRKETVELFPCNGVDDMYCLANERKATYPTAQATYPKRGIFRTLGRVIKAAVGVARAYVRELTK